MKRFILFSILAALLMSFSTGANAQGGPPPEIRRAISGVVAMAESEGDDALKVCGQVAGRSLSQEFPRERRTAATSANDSRCGARPHLFGQRHALSGRDANDRPRRRCARAAHARRSLPDHKAGVGEGRSRITAGGSCDRRPASAGSGSETTGDERRSASLSRAGAQRAVGEDTAGTLAMLERDHFSAEYLQRTSRSERLDLVGKIRAAAASASTILVNEDPEGVHIHFDESAGPIVSFTMDTRAPFRISSLKLGPSASKNVAAGPAMTWNDLIPRSTRR